MTDEERAAVMQKIAEQFIADADKNMQGPSNEHLTVAMLGTITGACAVMLARGVPFANVSASINSMLSDMAS